MNSNFFARSPSTSEALTLALALAAVSGIIHSTGAIPLDPRLAACEVACGGSADSLDEKSR